MAAVFSTCLNRTTNLEPTEYCTTCNMQTHPTEQIFQSIHWWLIDLEGIRLQWEETG